MKRIALLFGLFVLIQANIAHACEFRLAKYATQKSVNFCLHVTDETVGAVKLETASHASGDTYVMKDEGNEANTTNGFTDEGSCYNIVLTSTEMTAARVTLNIEDQSTKTWADKCIVFETYGHASAEHGFDLDAPSTDGVTVSESAATPAAGQSRYGLASGAVDADDQFNNGFALLVFDSAGSISARSCIFDSANAGDTVDLREDITALTANGDSYIVQADAGCTVAALGTQAKADVNTEVVDTLTVDTYGELTACPTATATLKDILQFLLMVSRNKVTQTATTGILYKDNGSDALCTFTDSDNGVTFTAGEGG